MVADLQLLRRYAAWRDAEAFTLILRRHQDLVYGTCLRILGNRADAEDAAQECFFRLARNAESVHSSLAGWLHSCATSTALNATQQARARSRREKAYGEAKIAKERAAADEETWKDIEPLVDEALEQLPEELRVVLIERFLRQRTQAEVAEELGISRATLIRRAEAGIQMIRKKLRAAGVLLSAGLLVGLLADHAAVAAPATLAFSVGKVAIAGIGQTAGGTSSSASAAASVAPASFTPTAATSGVTFAGAFSLKTAAAVVASAVVVVGLGAGLYWYFSPERPPVVAAVATAGGPGGGPAGAEGDLRRDEQYRTGQPGRGPGGATRSVGGPDRPGGPGPAAGPSTGGATVTSAPAGGADQPIWVPTAPAPSRRDVQWVLVPAASAPDEPGEGRKWTLVPVTSLTGRNGRKARAGRGRDGNEGNPD